MNSSETAGPHFVDATFFLGMHDSDEQRRMQSLQLFTHCLTTHLFMNLEQVGLCDDVIWCRNRQEQDAYYPFMDNLHTLLRIQRIGFTRDDLTRALRDPQLRHLPLQQACTLSQVMNRNGRLHTHDPLLWRDVALQPWLAPPLQQPEQPFPEPLDSLYQDSLRLTLDLQESRYV